ncbi:hypothetical protein [Pseudomonas sp. KU43P]|uniref:hypothetical protein n=1 Tax=Pseudomonas sp. KU43P TaxID=2487887 RepID=UPI0012AA1496|nr:hypothetical protein [Pseudomonas sp. KU43P]BBH44717.1 hypothetical protein KU43P_11940 [Pseudomonas sp. KU43P]
MGNSTRTWQLISLMLAVALILALIKLDRTTPTNRPVTGTSSTIDSGTPPEQLALSPNSRRAHERYSL